MDDNLYTSKSEDRGYITKMRISEDEGFRKVEVGLPTHHKLFKSNKVVTARYTWYTWIPKSLLMQFTRVNNIYFLIMSILSTMPFSPKNPFSLGATLAAVLIFTIFKEGYEDLARHRQDKEVNEAKFHKFSVDENKFVKIKSEDIKVGDILKIDENESFPADLVMIANSQPKGIAFVNTMNLDGETNLKEKEIAGHVLKLQGENDLNELKAEFYVDLPNSSLVKWNCNLKIAEKKEPLSMKQLLLRGCVLKNTDWVYGVCVYTGVESKIVMNSKKAPTKSSNIQKSMNKILASVFFLQILICFVFAGLGEDWLKKNKDAEYIDLPDPNGVTFILRVLTYWVGYSHLIPISLYVALELVRLFLSNFIKSDLKMYDKSSDRPAKCRASDLIEELGQVHFIFSDKTGTLTCNEMIFRKCSVSECLYGTNDSFISEDELMRSGLTSGNPDLIQFFYLMTLCNSVFPANHNDIFVYQASSPDELALVEAAKSLGFVLKERSEGQLHIEVNGLRETWQLLVEIPFNSDRKRMSVVLKDPRSKKIILYTKGADSKMLPLVEKEKRAQAEKDLSKFAVSGLRTLVLGYKELEEKDFEIWYSGWKDIQMTNSENKEKNLDEHADLLEENLKLAGITAIEDRLQDGVPDTIKVLMDADIRVWVLTGDKEETAIEIAKSCNLIQSNMKVVNIFSQNQKDTEDKVNELFEEYDLGKHKDFNSLEIFKSGLNQPLALVINGIALSFVLEDKEIKEKFFKLGFISNSCVCCRVSPSQKMLVVRLASTYGKWISLAIGDGANDVSMIQEAHIGVGIAGKEGTQAVQASEFTFCQFKSLKRLLLVHGRFAYFRISIFILYYFYKNFLSVFTELWFALFSGFSGQIYFLDWLPSLYNTFWTSWPCLTFFTLERDLHPTDSLIYSGLYSAGQKSFYFNIRSFWKWLLFAFLSACWIYWLPVVAISQGVDFKGREPSLFWMSTVSFVMLIHTVNLKLLITTQFWPKGSL